MPFVSRKLNVSKKVKLANLRDYYPLIGVLLLSLVLRMLWLKTLIQRDEGGAGYIAMLWSQGYLPYVHSLDNKPPLHYFIYLVSVYLFGNTIIPIRIFNNILFLVSIVILYLIAKDWYSKRVAILSAFIYGVFMNAPIFEGQLALSYSFSAPFVVFSIYFCNRFLKHDEGKNRLFMSGMFMSASALILHLQAVGIFLLLLMVLSSKKASSKGSTQKIFTKDKAIELSVLAVGISVPIIITALYFWSYGALDDLIDCLFFRLFRINFFGRADVSFGHKFLIIVEGLPLWLLSIFGCIKCILRSKMYDRFLLVWILLFTFAASIPPHFGRRYSLIIGPASILSGIALSSILANFKLISVRNFLRNYERNTSSLFIIVVVVLSFASSIALQTKQYPNYNIDWEFIWWYYADMQSYDQQIELANYLKSHAPNEQILVHGWDPQTYWLSGHRAPSIHVYTADMGLDIQEEEFNEIVERIKRGDFGYIVIFPTLHGQDLITDSTYQNYFHVKTIGIAQIFSKYNCTSEGH